jgi:hypothetical protein
LTGVKCQGLTKAHLRRLVWMMSVGMVFFVALFLFVHIVLIYAGAAPDPTVYRFYPIMAGLGALFGFERWWAHEQGGVNPFHDK